MVISCAVVGALDRLVCVRVRRLLLHVDRHRPLSALMVVSCAAAGTS